jgi:hypothetical protein
MWFRKDLKEFAQETIFGSRDEYLNYTFVEQCWNQHQRGQRDWSYLLWTVLMFKAWEGVAKAA